MDFGKKTHRMSEAELDRIDSDVFALDLAFGGELFKDVSKEYSQLTRSNKHYG